MSDDFDAKARAATGKLAIYEFLGLEVVAADGEVFKARVPLNANTANHVNMMHAGVLFAVGEVLGGLVAIKHLAKPEKFQPVVRSVTIDFKAPALTPITAEATFSAAQAAEMNAKLDETGKYDFELKASLKDENGTLVAETLGSYAIRNFLGG